MTVDEYQKLVNHLPTEHENPRMAYMMSHSPSYYYDEWVQYFKDEQLMVYRSYMSDDEQELYSSLPNTLTVYRGVAVDGDYDEGYGLSWTLNKEVARFFSEEYTRRINKHLTPIILEQTINKQDIAWILLEREEEEVVVIPNESREHKRKEAKEDRHESYNINEDII